MPLIYSNKSIRYQEISWYFHKKFQVKTCVSQPPSEKKEATHFNTQLFSQKTSTLPPLALGVVDGRTAPGGPKKKVVTTKNKEIHSGKLTFSLLKMVVSKFGISLSRGFYFQGASCSVSFREGTTPKINTSSKKGTILKGLVHLPTINFQRIC